jgi:cytochrome c-type biogenesis protein CcmH
MTVWILAALMCLLAAVFIALPVYKQRKRVSPNITLVVVAVLAASVGLYAYQGSPDLPSGRGGDTHSMAEVVAALEARLADQPDDLGGWVMLGRTHLNQQNFAGAVTAFEKAVELEESSNAQTIVSLGEALLARDRSGVTGRPAALFESALAIDPNNPQALFYSGIAAANAGRFEQAASRWEQLQGLNPPAEIRDILQQKIAEWRGDPPVAPASAAAAPAQMPVAQPAANTDGGVSAETPADGMIVSVDLGIAPAAKEAIGRDAAVFIIARDPAVPSPPIAVVRRSLSELPVRVDLSDGNSMMQGRMLSMFEEVELIARVSLSGQPTAQPGDWFASAVVRPAEQARTSLTIDQQVQ